jgi:hypothetical protein
MNRSAFIAVSEKTIVITIEYATLVDSSLYQVNATNSNPIIATGTIHFGRFLE